MKKIILLALGLVVCACSIIGTTERKYKESLNTKEEYLIIPKPVSLEITKGKFVLDKTVNIKVNSELESEGEYLSEMLNVLISGGITYTTERDVKANIVLKIDESIQNNEGYILSIAHDKIVISGKNAKGVFYGIQTLQQLIPLTRSDKGVFLIPACIVKDSPRYVYRGMHLDVARHYFPTSFIKKYIDILAMHKMNVFHWHLTEDQGWRIEIKKYPKLTSIGSVRKETIVGHGATWNKGNAKYDGEPYGGFYTQKEVKEIVAYAKRRHITIIPEIELPGHSLAAITAYPELGNTGEQYQVGTRWGVFPEIYAPSEKTFQFLEDVLSEVIELFPSKLIHIGGDEAPKTQWKNSLLAQEIIKKEGLQDEHELQSYFIKRIEKFLNSRGRDIVGWDEILEGGLAPNATVMSWRGEKGGVHAAKMNHNVIMTPTRFCYFDFYQTEDKANEPLAIGGRTTVQDVYSYEPTPKELSEDEGKYVLGAQGNVWTEYMITPEHVEYMILPRLTALSEVVWSKKEKRNWKEFQNRLNHISHLYDAKGVNYAKHSLTSVSK